MFFLNSYLILELNLEADIISFADTAFHFLSRVISKLQKQHNVYMHDGIKTQKYRETSYAESWFFRAVNSLSQPGRKQQHILSVLHRYRMAILENRVLWEKLVYSYYQNNTNL